MKGLVKVVLMILGIVSVMMSNLYAESYIKVWERTYGGSKWDEAYAVIPMEDGNFIIAGCTKSFGNGKSDVYIIKIDRNGRKIWERTYGGREDEGAYAITPTEDGGFIVVGWTKSFGNGGGDVYLIKIDRNGRKIWERTYGGSKWDEAYAVVPTKDGGFIVAGGTESLGNGGKDVYIIKIDKNGKKIWEKAYGGPHLDIAYTITPTEDGGFIVAGCTKSFGNGGGDVYLIKINKDGNKIWERTYGGRHLDGAYAIALTKEGGFIIAGETVSFGNGGGDVYLIKIDKNGRKIWERTYGGSKWDEGHAITSTEDNNFIVAGCTNSFGNSKGDVYIIKIDKDGNKIWERTYGGRHLDGAYAIALTKEGGFIIAGETVSFGNGGGDVYLIRDVK